MFAPFLELLALTAFFNTAEMALISARRRSKRGSCLFDGRDESEIVLDKMKLLGCKML